MAIMVVFGAPPSLLRSFAPIREGLGNVFAHPWFRIFYVITPSTVN